MGKPEHPITSGINKNIPTNTVNVITNSLSHKLHVPVLTIPVLIPASPSHLSPCPLPLFHVIWEKSNPLRGLPPSEPSKQARRVGRFRLFLTTWFERCIYLVPKSQRTLPCKERREEQATGTCLADWPYRYLVYAWRALSRFFLFFLFPFPFNLFPVCGGSFVW